MTSLADQLRNWRSRHRLSEDEAAQILGITRRTLENLERGVAPNSKERQELFEKISRPPGLRLKGP